MLLNDIHRLAVAQEALVVELRTLNANLAGEEIKQALVTLMALLQKIADELLKPEPPEVVGIKAEFSTPEVHQP